MLNAQKIVVRELEGEEEREKTHPRSSEVFVERELAVIPLRR